MKIKVDIVIVLVKSMIVLEIVMRMLQLKPAVNLSRLPVRGMVMNALIRVSTIP